MLDLKAIKERHRRAEGYDADAACAAQALIANDIPALIAENRELRQAIRDALAKMEQTDAVEAYALLLLAISGDR